MTQIHVQIHKTDMNYTSSLVCILVQKKGWKFRSNEKLGYSKKHMLLFITISPDCILKKTDKRKKIYLIERLTIFFI